jgi:L-ribulose-5-phosphate 3-epimerase
MELATSLNVFDIEWETMHRELVRCAEAGFFDLDFNYCDYYSRILKEISWQRELEWASQIRESGDAAGVRFVQAHGPMYSGTLDSTFMEYCERSLRSSAIVGAKWVVFHPINLSAASYDHSHQRMQLQRNIDFIHRILPIAEQVGVGIAIENMMDARTREGGCRRVFGSVPEELIDIVDAVDHPLVGICWDTGHALIQGLDQHRALLAVGHRLKATHIQDNDGVFSSHYLPFHGKIDWDEILRTLHEMKYEGAFTFETHRAIRNLPDALRDSALRHASLLGNYLLNVAGR